MNNCLLCKINKADKTGSHIIPHFLMKRIDNEIGKTERGKELGFTIGEMETSSYFGQSILPEKLNEIYGELSEKKIEENNVPLIVNHFYCLSALIKYFTIELLIFQGFMKVYQIIIQNVHESLLVSTLFKTFT